MIRTKDSSVFESAFFILRASSCNVGANGDIVSEANRILEESNSPRRKKSVPKLKYILAAAGIGFILGAALLGGVWIVVAL